MKIENVSCCEHCKQLSANAGFSENDDQNKTRKSDLLKIIIGAVLFVICLLLDLTIIDLRAYTNQTYITLAFCILSYLFVGFETVFQAIKNIFRGKVFDENFLMTIATFGAFAIGEYPEAVAVMLFYRVGEYFEDIAVNYSKKSIRALLDLQPDYANLLENG
ncbi:MAG: heavy metal translocating P-type ATPase, partial [Spirochaetaceae bacterium]|nr:heavy metal translocating P-type ATPase [Spirochaetaceae bacterium]